MHLDTGWLEKPNLAGGLDHLGTAAPGFQIYSQLLPGITNVTDRARYYALYPWVIWSFEKRFPDADSATFKEYFRRADCLLTLLSERHARTLGEPAEAHGLGMAGRDRLLPALDALQAVPPLRLSMFTHLEPAENRYFKNPLGGLGQYYAGVLQELRIMDTSAKPWAKYTIEHGQPLAEAVHTTMPGDHFWSVVLADEVTLADLDTLSPLCQCGLRHSASEQRMLLDTFFDRQDIYKEKGLGRQRRRTLALILHLAQVAHAQGLPLDEGLFRRAVYSARLSPDAAWHVPAVLEDTRKAWALYERNDLLSVVVQHVFAVCLNCLLERADDSPLDPRCVEDYAASLADSPLGVRAQQKVGLSTFRAVCDALAATGRVGDHWYEPGHECSLSDGLLSLQAELEHRATGLKDAMELLALLHAKDLLDQNPYQALLLAPESLLDTPIHLGSFRSRCLTWLDMPLRDVYADLFTWVMNSHLKVALRKMRQAGYSTFRFRPTDNGLVVVAVPVPGNSAPRIRQALQMLRDLGVLERTGPQGLSQASLIGRDVLEHALV